MIDKILGAIVGFGAASMLSKKTFAKGGSVDTDLEVTSIKYYETRRGLGYVARTNKEGVEIRNDGRGGATVVMGKNAGKYRGLTESDLERLIDKHEKFAKGGKVDSFIDNLKKGDTFTMKFGSSISKDNQVQLQVRSRNKVKKGTVDKITFVNMANPTGVKYYAYKYDRYKDRGWMFAKGDLAISTVEILN